MIPPPNNLENAQYAVIKSTSHSASQSLWDCWRVPLVTARECSMSDGSALYQQAGHHLLLHHPTVIKGYWMIFLHCNRGGVGAAFVSLLTVLSNYRVMTDSIPVFHWAAYCVGLFSGRLGVMPWLQLLLTAVHLHIALLFHLLRGWQQEGDCAKIHVDWGYQS